MKKNYSYLLTSGRLLCH